MKPDGVDTASMEPMEAIGAEPLVEGTATEEDPQQDPLQSHSDEAEKQQQPEMAAAPPAVQEGNSKPADAKTKAKGPGKTKPGAAAVKSSTAGPGSRPGTAQNRPVNGVQKPLSNGVQRKVTGAVPEKKPSASAAASRKPAAAAAAGSAKVPAKVPARKSGGSSNGGPGAAVPAQPKKGPAGGPAGGPADGAKAKPKMAASKPAAAKPDRSAVSRATRPAGGPPPPRPTSTTTAGKPVVNSTTTSRPASSRATAPPAGRNTAAQPTKPTTPAKKDVSKLTTVPVKKPAAAPTRAPPAKTAKSDAPKTSAAARPEPAAKRALSANKPADAKTSRPKPQDGKPAATRVGTASPRSIGSKPGLSKAATASPKKPEGGGAPVPVSKSSKPKRPAQPLSASGEPAKEEEPPKPADVAEAAAVAGSVTAATEATPSEPQLAAEQEPASVGQQEAQLQPELDVQPTSTAEVEPVVEALAQEVDQAPPSVDVLPSSPAGPTEGQSPLDDQSRLSPKIPKNLSPEMGKQEEGAEKVCKPVMEADMFVPKNVGAGELVDLVVQPELTTLVPAEVFTAETPVLLAQEPGLAVEKADEEINEDNDYGGDVEEEEKEVSQQISVSEMSGTQPTEDSRPGSAGLAGSMWRGGALVSELDSEDVSCSQQGASELSAPGVLEGTESLDDLGEASLKGADGEGASAGSPDLEIVPDIPANEEDEDDEDEEDRVYDMEVGSERAEDPRRARQEGEDEEEDEDVEMASEGVTESGLESYGNADEDDFAEDDRLDNLNRAQPHLLLSTAPAPHWAQANPLGESCTQPLPLAASALLVSPSSDPWQADPDTPVQAPAEPWMEFCAPVVPQVQEPVFHLQVIPEPRSDDVQPPPAAPAVEENLMSVEPIGLPVPARGMSQSSTLSGTELAAQSSSDTSTPEELREYNSSSGVESEDKLKTPMPQQQPDVEQDMSLPLERGEGEEEEAETLPADEVLGGPATAPASDPSSPSASEDEASDTEGEMLVHDPGTLGSQTLPATEEREEAGQLPYGEGEDGGDTPQSANSVASYGFDCTTSNSNAHSTQSPGIFSLENEDQLLEETKDPTIKELTLGAATAEPPLGAPVDLLPLGALREIQSNPEEQEYMLCGKRVAESPIGETAPPKAGLPLTPQEAREGTDGQPAYYSAICEKTDSVLAGGCELQPNQQPPPAQSQANHVGSVEWKTYSQPPSAHLSPAWQPTDLQSSTPQAQPNLQLRRLEQHQKHLQQIQERQEQQNRERRKELELEAELRELEEEEENEKEDEEKLWREQRRKLEKQRQDLLQLQFQHQQQELKHRQQILQWQQELVQQQQQHKTQSAVLQSPTSVLCTIYEAKEASDEEGEEVGDDMVEEKNSELEERVTVERQEGGMQEEEKGEDPQVDQGDPKTPNLAPLLRPTKLSPRADQAQLGLDWDKKVDIVQQLINQTLLLAGDGCPPLLLLPGGGGGTLSPLESSMWPTLLPPLTPPSATVTSVSSFSPEDQGSSPQGEWTVVELETHH
uniref:Titin-like n=1 Tax=Paramormyrops kingsleyae TaxID=1676925 RepID=A0A3B3S2A2_9TELE|nr:titin-like [Paramormyrops kingsleyae]XP_023647639.1 titin-like [Paramormyrops kingsleyae]